MEKIRSGNWTFCGAGEVVYYFLFFYTDFCRFLFCWIITELFVGLYFRFGLSYRLDFVWHYFFVSVWERSETRTCWRGTIGACVRACVREDIRLDYLLHYLFTIYYLLLTICQRYDHFDCLIFAEINRLKVICCCKFLFLSGLLIAIAWVFIQSLSLKRVIRYPWI